MRGQIYVLWRCRHCNMHYKEKSKKCKVCGSEELAKTVYLGNDAEEQYNADMELAAAQLKYFEYGQRNVECRMEKQKKISAIALAVVIVVAVCVLYCLAVNTLVRGDIVSYYTTTGYIYKGGFE